MRKNLANLFLDANAFIDITQRHKVHKLEDFTNHSLYISPLSVHILCYVYKYHVPQASLNRLLQELMLVPATEKLVSLASQGPTPDFEDNFQLHSAEAANCSIFLTSDEVLLEFGSFGQLKLRKSLA